MRHLGTITLAILAASAAASALAADPPTAAAWQAVSGLLPEEVCPPWTLTDTAPGADPVSEGATLLLTTAAPAEDMFYVQTPTIPLPDPLVVEARVQLLSGQATLDNRGPVAIGITVAPDTGTLFFLEAGAAFLTTTGDVRGATAAFDTASPHTYRIEVTAAGAVTVFADGAPLLSGVTYASAPAFGPAPRILWGEGSLYASGSERWETFAHNARSCPSGTTTTAIATTSTTTTSTTTLEPPPTTPGHGTSTTLPPGVCEAAQPGSTTALLCRVELLRQHIGDVLALGSLRPKLAATADRLIARIGQARTACEAGDAAAAARRVKQAGRLLQRMMRRLGGLAARHRLDASLRSDLLGTITEIRTDAVALRAAPCDAG